MKLNVQVGTIMIREGFHLPEPVKIETDGYSKRWRTVKGTDGFNLAKDIQAAGWNYFFNAGQFKANFLGWRPGKNADRAFARILDQAHEFSFNSLEVTEISRRVFLGIPYTAISAHGRHIQQSHLLQAQQERRLAG